MDEFMCSDVVRGRISGVDDCRAKSAGASMFKWFLGHLVEAHFALFCSYKYKDERRTIVAGGHVLDSEQVLWSDERCFNAEQSTERLLAVHMVLVVHVEGLCAEVRCVGMGGGDGHGSFCFVEFKPGKGRGGGEVRCERYYVVGREQGVAAALQT